MVYDIQALKKIGYNMLRKHIKVEPPLYYAAADELGILVMQDMPALRPSQSRTLDNCTVETILPDDAQQAEFQRQLEVMVTQFRSYTSIFAWVIYNEGWGQITSPYYPEFELTDIVRQLDPTRIIDSVTVSNQRPKAIPSHCLRRLLTFDFLSTGLVRITPGESQPSP